MQWSPWHSRQELRETTDPPLRTLVFRVVKWEVEQAGDWI